MTYAKLHVFAFLPPFFSLSIPLFPILANVSDSPFFFLLAHRFEILPTEVRKREKSPKFLSGLKSRKEKRHIEPESSEKHLKLLDTIRIQMQVHYSVHLSFYSCFWTIYVLCITIVG